MRVNLNAFSRDIQALTHAHWCIVTGGGLWQGQFDPASRIAPAAKIGDVPLSG